VKIYLGTDHRGFELKEKIKAWLSEYEVEDMGAYELDPKDDYTLYAEKVASMVADNDGMGILLCGSGVGVDVAANKFDRVRASVGISPEQVSAGRHDDDMNILVLAADYSDEKKAIEMVKAFLKTNFSGEERHKRRIKDIERIEANN
jgi:ribose 5-phosphate isomerase B